MKYFLKEKHNSDTSKELCVCVPGPHQCAGSSSTHFSYERGGAVGREAARQPNQSNFSMFLCVMGFQKYALGSPPTQRQSPPGLLYFFVRDP